MDGMPLFDYDDIDDVCGGGVAGGNDGDGMMVLIDRIRRKPIIQRIGTWMQTIIFPSKLFSRCSRSSFYSTTSFPSPSTSAWKWSRYLHPHHQFKKKRW